MKYRFVELGIISNIHTSVGSNMKVDDYSNESIVVQLALRRHLAPPGLIGKTMDNSPRVPKS